MLCSKDDANCLLVHGSGLREVHSWQNNLARSNNQSRTLNNLPYQSNIVRRTDSDTRKDSNNSSLNLFTPIREISNELLALHNWQNDLTKGENTECNSNNKPFKFHNPNIYSELSTEQSTPEIPQKKFFFSEEDFGEITAGASSPISKFDQYLTPRGDSEEVISSFREHNNPHDILADHSPIAVTRVIGPRAVDPMKMLGVDEDDEILSAPKVEEIHNWLEKRAEFEYNQSVQKNFQKLVVPADPSEQLGLTFSGIFVAKVEDGSTAKRMGVLPDDRLVSVNDEKFQDSPIPQIEKHLKKVLEESSPPFIIELARPKKYSSYYSVEFTKKIKQPKQDVTEQNAEANTPKKSAKESKSVNFDFVEERKNVKSAKASSKQATPQQAPKPFKPTNLRVLGFQCYSDVIINVEADSWAANLGMQPGDVLISINSVRFKALSQEEVAKLVGDMSNNWQREMLFDLKIILKRAHAQETTGLFDLNKINEMRKILQIPGDLQRQGQLSREDLHGNFRNYISRSNLSERFNTWKKDAAAEKYAKERRKHLINNNPITGFFEMFESYFSCSPQLKNNFCCILYTLIIGQNSKNKLSFKIHFKMLNLIECDKIN